MCSSSEVPLTFAFPKLSETSPRLARYNVKQSETPAVTLEQAKIWVKEQETTALNLLPFTLIGHSVCNCLYSNTCCPTQWLSVQ